MNVLTIFIIIILASAIRADKPPGRHASECDDSGRVTHRNTTCNQVCYERNGSCTFDCNKKSFAWCGQICKARDCRMNCDTPGYCLQICNKGCKSSCNSGTCKQLCSNGNCELDCSGKVCDQSCATSTCSLRCAASADTCTQDCIRNAKCRRLVCSSRECRQTCAKEGCVMECKGRHCHQTCTAPEGKCRMTCHAGAEMCIQVCPNDACVTECHAKKCVRVSHAGPSRANGGNPSHVITGPTHKRSDMEVDTKQYATNQRIRYSLSRGSSEVVSGPTPKPSDMELDTEEDLVTWPPGEYSIVLRFSSRKVSKLKNSGHELKWSSVLMVLFLILSFKLSLN